MYRRIGILSARLWGPLKSMSAPNSLYSLKLVGVFFYFSSPNIYSGCLLYQNIHIRKSCMSIWHWHRKLKSIVLLIYFFLWFRYGGCSFLRLDSIFLYITITVLRFWKITHFLRYALEGDKERIFWGIIATTCCIIGQRRG